MPGICQIYRLTRSIPVFTAEELSAQRVEEIYMRSHSQLTLQDGPSNSDLVLVL